MRRAIEATLRRAWQRRGPLACALLPLAWLYGALSALRRFGYAAGWLRSRAVGVPVIVVGNVVAGGAGKTPVTIELVLWMRARGIAVGVISRGYGRRPANADDAPVAVHDDSAPAQVGDEPLLIRRATGVPVVVGADRVAAARALLARHPALRVVVSDDGLQHLALRRDAELCVSGEAGAGNGWLLPAGPLRERGRRVTWLLDAAPARAAGSARRRAVVSATHGRFRCERRLAAHALRPDGTRVPLAGLAGAPLHAIAAVAHPERFFAMLRQRGLSLQSAEALPDHYDFDSWKPSWDQRETLICTEKDAVKLWPLYPDALAVPLELSIEPGFFVELDAWLGRHGLAPDASLSCADGHPTT